MYAIIDVETTGGSPVAEKITEIAIFLHNGEKVIDEFVTLINPEKSIPYYITALTGITNAMVANAPKFYEVARQIVELTAECIIVAHNASFDYQFIRNEFKRLGYDYSRDRLCTVQLSRRLIPGLTSYSLGKLCRHLNIQIHDRHRASGDAYATVKLFEYLLEQSKNQDQIIIKLPGVNKKDLHPNLRPEILDNLPEKAGIYYFFNEKQELIYIGKSKNIRTRVLSHFRNYSSRKAIEMMNSIADIDFELTGSELIALLKESYEIKQNRPMFNRAQRRSVSNYGLYTFYDNKGYLRFAIARNTEHKDIPLRTFSTLASGKRYLNSKADVYDLCQKLCGLYPGSGSCFNHEVSQCKGACIGKESPENYNERARQLINENSVLHDTFFLLDSGRHADESAVVQVECGKYIGYGYIDISQGNRNIDLLADCIESYDDNWDIQQIIRNYLLSSKMVKIIPYNKGLH
jgi:DNA polymerase-3 subunit epsilon